MGMGEVFLNLPRLKNDYFRHLPMVYMYERYLVYFESHGVLD